MLVTLDAVTDVGSSRDVNEDRIAVGGFVSTGSYAELAVSIDTRDQPLIVAVYDGMGGHAAGDRASQAAATAIAGSRCRTPADVETALLAADAAVKAEMQLTPSSQGMGSTVAGLVLAAETAIVFNVGDSRVYTVVDGSLVQVSVDDTPPPLPGQPPDARTTVVTQGLGTTRTDSPHPHVRELGIGRGDRFLLCTDGLTDYASLDSVEDALAQPGTRAAELCHLALAGGGGDNVSVLLVSVR